MAGPSTFQDPHDYSFSPAEERSEEDPLGKRHEIQFKMNSVSWAQGMVGEVGGGLPLEENLGGLGQETGNMRLPG